MIDILSAAPITCALLDAQGVYQGMVSVAPHALTDRHLPTITECDLPAGEYQWVPASETANPFGGEFVALKFLRVQARLNAQAEQAAAGGVRAGSLQAAIDAAVAAKIKTLLGA